MKALVILPPFLLLILLSISGTVVGKTPAVFDLEGNEVLNGQFYYVLPTIWGSGGGLLLADMLNGTCPLKVIQSESNTEDGLALTFIADNALLGGYVHESSNVVLRFVAVTLCPDDGSLVLTVDNHEESTELKFLTSGGDGCRNSWFKIESVPVLKNAYKLVYCIGGECKDVGVHAGDGVKYLVLSETPLIISFKRVKYSDV